MARRALLAGAAPPYRLRRRSLSEVARQITASRWSGPLFFGLRHQLDVLCRQQLGRPRLSAVDHLLRLSRAMTATGRSFGEANDSRSKQIAEDWMRVGKRAMSVSARRKEPGRHEKYPITCAAG
jgi:hypothetical protein